MPQEHRPPTPTEAASTVPRVRRIVEPPDPNALLTVALARIGEDGSVLFDTDRPRPYRQPSRPPEISATWDDTTWAYKALDIATVIYQRLHSTPDPEYALSSLALFLTAFRHDPALLQAAVSLIVADGEFMSPPQNATGNLRWRESLARLRTR